MNNSLDPKLLLILLAFGISLIGAPANADVWKGRIVPTFQRGFDLTGLAIIASGGMATGLTQPFDYDVRSKMRNHQRISEEDSHIGDILGTGIPGASIALLQLAFDTENGVSHTEALIETFIATSILKVSNKRNRPASANRWSMPSGHTSTAFATATALSYSYGWWVAIPAFATATFVAMTRMSDDAHWLSDTVAGATIGIFWGRAASHKTGSTSSVKWIPTPIDGGALLTCHLSF